MTFDLESSSPPDTGKGKELKTGNLKRSYNMADKWAKKEKIRKADNAKIAKCKGKTGDALAACLKAIGRKVGKTGEWEKIRDEAPSSDVPRR